MDESYLFDAWGNALTGKGKVGTENKFQFTGQALDPSTGLYFLRARYYDPITGTFLSRDPFPGFATQPITLHHYIYAGNNPARFVDPSGLAFGYHGYLGLAGDSSQPAPADPEQTQQYICNALQQNGGYINRDSNPNDLSLRDAEHFLYTYTSTRDNPWLALPNYFATYGYSALKAIGFFPTATPPSIDEVVAGLRGIASGLGAAAGQPYQCGCPIAGGECGGEGAETKK